MGQRMIILVGLSIAACRATAAPPPERPTAAVAPAGPVDCRADRSCLEILVDA